MQQFSKGVVKQKEYESNNSFNLCVHECRLVRPDLNVIKT